MTQRIFSFLLALVMVIGLLPMPTWATETGDVTDDVTLTDNLAENESDPDAEDSTDPDVAENPQADDSQLSAIAEDETTEDTYIYVLNNKNLEEQDDGTYTTTIRYDNAYTYSDGTLKKCIDLIYKRKPGNEATIDYWQVSYYIAGPTTVTVTLDLSTDNATAEAILDTGAVTDITIHYYGNSSTFTPTNCYVWDLGLNHPDGFDEWPGSADLMKENTDYPGWYTVTLSDAYALQGIGVIFNDGGDNKTEDIRLVENDEYWYDGSLQTESPSTWVPKETAHTHTWSSDWTTDDTHHWHECTAEGCDVTDDAQKDGYSEHSYTDSQCKCGAANTENDTTVAIEKIVIVGSGGANYEWPNGSSWDHTAEVNQMTEIRDNVYQIKYIGMAAGEYEFKFVANEDWSMIWGSSSDEALVSGQPYEAVSLYSENICMTVEVDDSMATFTLDLTGKTATYTVVIEEPKAETTHNHDDVVFTQWTATDRLPSDAGNYCLAADVTLTEAWAPVGATSICLNGHRIIQTGAGICITVNSGVTMDIYDCVGSGKIAIDESLYGQVVYIDGGSVTLHNGSICGGDTAKSGGGGVHIVSGSFTMNGGIISGNYSYLPGNGGGVYVASGATFTMNGGTISGNKSAGNAGGVYNSGTFNMTGGTITGNTAKAGGGVVNSGTFTMTGGSITGNTATQYIGGVAQMGTMKVSGKAVIQDNLVQTDDAETGTVSNVSLLTQGEDGTCLTVGELTEGTSIGISCLNYETLAATSGTISNAAASEYIGYFFADDSAYEVTANDAGYLVLSEIKAEHVHTETLSSNGDGTHNRVCCECNEVIEENIACTFDENNTCACGYVNETVIDPVAEINGKQYATLMAAVEAAQAGETIKMLDDIEITEGVTFALPEGITLDLNGKTVKAAEAVLLVKGTGITIKNGTFARYNSKAYYLLTIEDGSATLEGLTFDKGGVKIRNSAVATLKENTITAYQSGFKYAVWAYGKAKVTIESGTYLGGKNGYDVFKEGSAKIYVYGGTYKFKNIQNFIPSGAELELMTNSDGTYSVVEASGVASVNGKKYKTLQLAIDAANTGDTVTLLENITADAEILIDKSLTLNLGEFTITGSIAGDGVVRIVADEVINVTISATTGGITNTAEGYAINSGNITDDNAKTTLIINGGNYAATQCIYQNNGLCTINGGSFKAADTQLTLNNKDGYLGDFMVNGGKFYLFNPACMSINKGEHHDHDNIATGKTAARDADGWYTVVEGAFKPVAQVSSKYESLDRCYSNLADAIADAKAATIAAEGAIIKLIADCTIDLSGATITLPDYATLDLNGHTLTVPFQKTLFAGNNITICNGTITTGSTENYGLYIMSGSFTLENVTTTNGINIQNAEVTLENSTVKCPNKYYPVYAGNGAKVTIKSGNFTAVRNANVLYADSTSTITAYSGTYNKKPADKYIAEGRVVVGNTKGTSYTVYEGLQAAIDAAAADSTVYLTEHVEAAETITIDKALTLELGAYTINSTTNVGVYANGGNLTINGTTGGITTTGTVAVGQDNGVCTINGGYFKATGNTHDVANGQSVKYRYTLDNSEGGNGSFVINGGSFFRFTPACMFINYNCAHDHDSIAAGKTAVLDENGWFTVAEGEVKYTIVCDCDYPAPSHQYCYASYEDALAALEINNCKWDKIVPITDVVNTGILHVGSGENKEKVIVIDAGHQIAANTDTEPNGPGSTTMKAKVASGTYGRFTGIKEYQLNLEVAIALRDELLSRGYTVVMVRETNEVDISNAERAQVANAWGADALIRIHANGSDDAKTSGAEGLCQSANNPYSGCKAVYNESLALTDSILGAYCTKTGMTRRYIWKTDTMTGINWANVPATILELGYMTNEADDNFMATEEFKTLAAEGIANGLDAYFG